MADEQEFDLFDELAEAKEKIERLKTDLIYLIDRVMSEGSYSVFCKCESCERPREIAARWEV